MMDQIFGDEEDIFGDDPEVTVAIVITRDECVAHILGERKKPGIVGHVPESEA